MVGRPRRLSPWCHHREGTFVIVRVVSHVVCVVALLAAVLLPAASLAGVSLSELVGTAPDAAASEVVAPDGPSLIFVDRAQHPDEDDLATLLAFLSGDEGSHVEEGLSCLVAADDAEGLALAVSLADELGEGQMGIRTEDGFLVVSKVGSHRFDVVVMSEAYAERLGAASLVDDPLVEVVRR